MRRLISFFLIFSSSSLLADPQKLTQTLKEMLRHDPQMQNIELQSTVIQTQWAQGLSRFLLPSVDLSFGESEQRNNVSLATAASRFDYGTLGVNWTLFSFGRDFYNFRSQSHQLKAQEQRVLTQLIEREQHLIGLIFQNVQLSKLQALFQKRLQLQEESYLVAKERSRQGLMSLDDVQRIELDLSNIKAEVIQTQRDKLESEAQLNQWSPQTHLNELPWTDLWHSAVITALINIKQDYQALPQIKRVSLEQEAAQAEYISESLRHLGQLQFSYSRSYYDFPEQERLWEWRTSLVYSIPLFAQYDIEVQRRRAQAQRNLSEIQKTFEISRLQQLWDYQKKSLELFYQNWIERLKAFELSQQLFKSTQRRFRNGQISVNELFIEQNRLIETERTYLQANLQLHLQTLQFCHSRGLPILKGCLDRI